MRRRDGLEVGTGCDGSAAAFAGLPAPLRQPLRQGLGICRLQGEGMDWRAEPLAGRTPVAKLLWVRTGRLAVRQAQRQQRLQAGDALILDPAQPLHLQADEGFDHLVAVLPDAQRPLREAARHAGGARPLPPGLAAFLSNWQEASAGMPWLAQWHTAQAAQAWALAACRPAAETPAARLRAQARAAVARDPANWDALQLAVHLRVSRRHLDAALAEEGTTASRLIWEVRLSRARAALLAEPEPSITALAFELGFKDSAHFSRLFRQRHGAAPRQWRARQLLEQDPR